MTDSTDPGEQEQAPLRGFHDDEQDYCHDTCPTRGRCAECGDECESITADFGIGSYDYAGAPGFDVRLAQVSPCCEARVLSEEEYQDREVDRRAMNNPCQDEGD